jgi:predicted nucleic acid-binding Zn ribbon protein
MARTLERHESCPGCGKPVDRYGENVAAVILFCSHECKTMVKGGSRRGSTPSDVALSMLVALLSAVAFAGFVLVAYRLLAPHL